MARMVASPESASPEEAARLMRAATYASVATALILIAVKLVAWRLSGSISLLSSLVDSLVDALASLVNLLAVRHSLQPADREHRFGHGKAEPLAGLGQAAFVVGSAGFVLVEAARRLMAPKPIEAEVIGIAVMVFAIFATLLLITFQRRVVARTRSVAIGADRLHYSGDVLMNGSVILSLVLSRNFGLGFLDPLFGALIGLYILSSAWAIARDSLQALMDREFPNEERERIRRIALSHPDVRAMHDLRTRSSGRNAFIQLHLELDGEMKLVQAHQIADQVERAIRAAFPHAEVIIHEDPSGVIEERAEFR